MPSTTPASSSRQVLVENGVRGAVGHEPHVQQLESEIFDASEQAVQSCLIQLGRQNRHTRRAGHDDVFEGRAQHLTGLTFDGKFVMSGHRPFQAFGPRLGIASPDGRNYAPQQRVESSPQRW